MTTMEQTLKRPVSQSFKRPPGVPMGRWWAALYFSVLGGFGLVGVPLLAILKVAGESKGTLDMSWAELLLAAIAVAALILASRLILKKPALGIALGLLVSSWDVVRRLSGHPGGMTLSVIGIVLCLWAATTLRKPG